MDAASIWLRAAIASGLLLVSLSAAAPVGWRADGNGAFPKADPPTVWEEKKNVVWKTKLPGHSYGSPIVVGERVLVVSEPSDLLCLNAADGAILWRQSLTIDQLYDADKATLILAEYKKLDTERRRLQSEQNKAKDDKEKRDELKKQLEAIELAHDDLTKRVPPPPHQGGGGNTAATPVSNGENVYVVLSNGIVGAFSLDGKRLWARYLESSKVGFGHASSPLLVDGKLVVHLRDLVALDPATGKESWRVPLGALHASPLALQIEKTWVVFSPVGAVVRASDGKVLLKSGSIGSHEGTPVQHNGVLYLVPDKARAYRLVFTGDDAVKAEKVWEASIGSGRRLPSPLLHDGLLYSVSVEGNVDVVDANKGEPVYRERLNIGQVYSSATAAGGYLFFGSTKGTTAVVAAGRDYRVVSRNKLEGFGTCPVFDGNRMFVRTNNHLYCIGE